MQSLMVLLRFFSNIFVLIFKLGLLQVAAGSVMIEQRLCSKPVSLLLIDLCMGREAHSKFRPFQIFSGFYFMHGTGGRPCPVTEDFIDHFTTILRLSCITPK